MSKYNKNWVKYKLLSFLKYKTEFFLYILFYRLWNQLSNYEVMPLNFILIFKKKINLSILIFVCVNIYKGLKIV
jgi:hypothetical protein